MAISIITSCEDTAPARDVKNRYITSYDVTRTERTNLNRISWCKPSACEFFFASEVMPQPCRRRYQTSEAYVKRITDTTIITTRLSKANPHDRLTLCYTRVFPRGLCAVQTPDRRVLPRRQRSSGDGSCSCRQTQRSSKVTLRGVS